MCIYVHLTLNPKLTNMKFLPFLCLMFIVCSCKIIKSASKELKAYNNEKYDIVNNQKLYFSDSAKTKLNVKINDSMYNMIFDLGAMGTVLYNPKFELSSTSIVSKRDVIGMDNKIRAASLRYVVDSLVIPGMKVQKKGISIINKQQQKICGSDTAAIQKFRGVDGILGNDIFGSADAYHINYEEGHIEFLPKQFTLENFKGYQQVDASFNFMEQVMLKLTINGKAKKFIFDTGNTTGGLFLNQSISELDNTAIPNYEIHTMLLGVGGIPVTKYTKVFENYPYLIGKDLELKTTFACDTSAKQNNWGQAIAKKFNWIVDVKHKKVYCKYLTPVIKPATPKANPFIQAATILNDKIVIYAVKKPVSKFDLGDEVISVNGQKVTKENQCDMLNVIYAAGNWDNLQLEVKHMNGNK